MDVILLERLHKYGSVGDIVSVKNGFARNYLLPQGKALRVTPENKAYFAERRAEIEARDIQQIEQAQAVGAKLAAISLVLVREAGETGSLYGSVSVKDIVEALRDEHGVSVDKRQVELSASLKATGSHVVPLMLHPEVRQDLTVVVARSAAEAKQYIAQSKAGDGNRTHTTSLEG